MYYLVLRCRANCPGRTRCLKPSSYRPPAPRSGRAYRGAFNDTQGQTLAGHVVAEAVRRAGIDPAEVEDVVLGAALQQGSTGYNVARQAAIRARIAGLGPRDDDRSPMLLRADGDRHRGERDRALTA